MLVIRSLTVVAFLSLLFAVFAPLAAQEEQPPADARRAAVEVQDLKLLLRPQTKSDLEEIAGHWVGLLKANAEAISKGEIAARAAEGEAKDPIIEANTKLKEERADLVDRVEVVLAAWEAKGGDPAEARSYVGVVAGSLGGLEDVDVTDVGAAWTTVVNWVKSEKGGIRWGKNILLFIVTLVAFKILGGILGRLTRSALHAFKGSSDLLRNFLVNTVRKLTFFIGIVVALSMLEVNIGPFLAAIGAAGFIIGFALQGTLSNFASGVMILLYRPYDIGDVVSVAGQTGKVEAMTLVSTTVKSFDNQVVVIPNSSIWGDVITNITGSETRRVDMVFGIGYEDDIKKARKVLEEIVNAHDLVLKTPEPVIRLHELADSSVNFVVRPWSKTSDYWSVKWDITEQVKERFDKEGISIPFPQQDVHVHQVAPA